MTRSPTLTALVTLLAVGLAAPAFGADDDADFVKQTASSGLLEVQLGKHAALRATDEGVRKFGRLMSKDHDKSGQELREVAQKAGIAVPSIMNEADQKLMKKLAAESGAAFDEQYAEAMVEGHEKNVKAFREQAEQGKTDVDRWAAKTLPTLESHLADAENLAKSLGGRKGAVTAAPPAGPASPAGPREEPGPLHENLTGTVRP